jgi:hypothetical protein
MTFLPVVDVLREIGELAAASAATATADVIFP